MASNRPIPILLCGMALLLTGTGMLGTLVPLALSGGGAPPSLVGLVASAYFGGLVIGALKARSLVMAVGHIRAFAAFSGLFAAATLGHVVVAAGPLWLPLRLVAGICMAGLFMVCESWLNGEATNESRGRVLSAYMYTVFVAQVVGQGALLLAGGHGSDLFAMAAVLLCLSLVPVAAMPIAAPQLHGAQPFSFARLYAISPLGVAGVAASGLLVGAFIGLVPLYTAQIGRGSASAGSLVAAALIGGLVAQFALGRASDRADRRHFIVAMGVATTLASLLVSATQGAGPLVQTGTVAVVGGAMFTLYPLSLAHANDFLAPAEVVPASGGLLLAYSVGAMLGPLAASFAMSALGPGGLWVFCGAIGALVAAFALWRMGRRAAVPVDQHMPFQTLACTSPAAAELDPRSG